MRAIAEVTEYLIARFAVSAHATAPFQALGHTIHQGTDGHPLFMVLVVDALVAQGALAEVAGQWQLRARLEDIAASVPASVRQVIEQQCERLGAEEQHVLAAASVVGAEFAAAVVAAGIGAQGERVEEWCEELVRRRQFLQAQGTARLPDGTITGRYSFRHAVYQTVLYERLTVTRRLRLHRRIGEGEEGVYGSQVGDIAAELALHFECGQDYERAVHYLEQAAHNALQRSAHREAIDHCTKGLALLQTLSDTPERAQQELALQMALGPALIATKGFAAPEVEQTYARARALCQQVGETPQLFPTLRGLCWFYITRGALPTARELGEQIYRLAQRTATPLSRLEAHATLGTALFVLGEYAGARTHLEQGLALAQSLDHPISLALALHFVAFLHHRRRDVLAAQALAEALLTLATAQGFPLYVGIATWLRGWALAMQGQSTAGLVQMHQGMAASLATGQTLLRSRCLILLAEAAGHAGQSTEGLHWLTEALTALEASGQGDMLTEAYRLQGELLLRQTPPDASQAEACFQQALAIARRQQAKSWELRATTSLSRLWQQQGKRAEARQLLTEIYGWFTEGFDTADVQDASALLAELA